MLKQTDRRFCSDKKIFMSLSAIYSYGETANLVAGLIRKTLPEFRNLLKLPASLIFRVAPIKSKTTRGHYNSDSKLVTLDCRLPWNTALEVLAHELVHAEQYHLGKLKKKFSQRKGWMHYWNGELGNKGTTYKAYRDQPWEQEAWTRQAGLAEKVSVALEIKTDSITTRETK